jgi:hypothetical protein
MAGFSVFDQRRVFPCFEQKYRVFQCFEQCRFVFGVLRNVDSFGVFSDAGFFSGVFLRNT